MVGPSGPGWPEVGVRMGTGLLQSHLKPMAGDMRGCDGSCPGPVPPTFPLLTFSAQALTYMGMAMTTSSQACTVPAFQWDMGVVRTSSTCCSRSICSSPSDRLRLCRVGLHWLSESVTHKHRCGHAGGREGQEAGGAAGRGQGCGSCICGYRSRPGMSYCPAPTFSSSLQNQNGLLISPSAVPLPMAKSPL